MSERRAQDEVSATIDATNEKNLSTQDGLSRLMIIVCYLLALLLVAFILYGVTTVIKEILGNFEFAADISRWDIISTSGAAYIIFILSQTLGHYWRSSEKNEIGTGITNFPNPFYDPNFVKGPAFLRREFNILRTKYKTIQFLLNKSKESIKDNVNVINSFESKLRVLIRHNDNTNRILKSYNYLIKINDINTTQRMLQYTISECITILEKDQSDKSISLFVVRDSQLHIIESNRINAESIAKRVFKKGEGFAGYIWEKGVTEIVNNIVPTDIRFHDQGIPATPIGSIIGVPLKVDNEIVGVLCLQSENGDGFAEADLRTVEFYSRMCTHIILCDKINYNKGVGKHDDDSREN